MTPSILNDLSTDHARIAKVLDALERQLDIFEDAGDPDYEVVRGAVDYLLAYPDQFHHPKEDLIYRLLSARRPDLADAIGDLVKEHELHGAMLRWVESLIDKDLLASAMPRESLLEPARAFVDAERHHMHRESAHFFPAAIEALTEADWAKVAEEARAAVDPLFDEEEAEKFEALRERLIKWDASPG